MTVPAIADLAYRIAGYAFGALVMAALIFGILAITTKVLAAPIRMVKRWLRIRHG